jgi:hypothetical protein
MVGWFWEVVEDFGNPNFIFPLTILFLCFLISLLMALGALVDLKKSLEAQTAER